MISLFSSHQPFVHQCLFSFLPWAGYNWWRWLGKQAWAAWTTRLQTALESMEEDWRCVHPSSCMRRRARCKQYCIHNWQLLFQWAVPQLVPTPELDAELERVARTKFDIDESLLFYRYGGTMSKTELNVREWTLLTSNFEHCRTVVIFLLPFPDSLSFRT